MSRSGYVHLEVEKITGETEKATDLICEDKGPKFQVIMGVGWRRHMECVLYEMATGHERMSLSQRLKICRCFTAVKYDEDLDLHEAGEKTEEVRQDKT